MTTISLSRAAWRKSTHSGQNGNCVEVATLARAIAVRDSRDPHGAKLILSPQHWRRFTAKVRTATFDAA